MFENLGHKLKTTRLNCNLSRKQIAELVGVSASMIGLYENGDRLPSLPVIVKLAAQYKVSVDYLLDCDTKSKDTLSLDGLTNDQIEALRLTIDCFRGHSK